MSGAPEQLRPVERRVTQEQVARYAEASGDHNPLHLDPEFAAGTPYGRPIAHGMLALAFLSELMAQEFGLAWLRQGRLKARFRAPVFPGDSVQAEGQLKSEANGAAVYSVTLTNQDGAQAITGEATVALDG